MKKADVIVVGQGIAGSVLALQLFREGKEVVMIDNPALSNCSKVAAGIYNPVVFKRLTKSWMANEGMDQVVNFFYREADEMPLKKVLHPMAILRILANKNEEELWKKKAQNELAEFLQPKIHKSDPTIPLAPIPFIQQNFAFVGGGYVDVPLFLEMTRSFFKEKEALIEESFTHAELEIAENEVRYKGLQAKKIVFCEGYLTSKNPWFKNVSLKPAKGEILTIYCEELQLGSIVNKDFFILPLEEPHLFKVGATYDWNNLDDLPTEKGRQELEEKFKNLVPFEYRVIKHEAGVRPASIDHRPILGFHPQHPQLGIFNGFGTKAILLAPFFAKHFCSFIQNKAPLWQEVDVKRFLPANTQ